MASWTLPKGEYSETEDALAAALREFEEETGVRAGGEFIPLGQSRQPGGKLVTAWAFESDCDPAAIRSNSFSMEWPRGSGAMREFSEIDRGEWFLVVAARGKILKGQLVFLDRLVEYLATPSKPQ